MNRIPNSRIAFVFLMIRDKGTKKTVPGIGESSPGWGVKVNISLSEVLGLRMEALELYFEALAFHFGSSAKTLHP